MLSWWWLAPIGVAAAVILAELLVDMTVQPPDLLWVSWLLSGVGFTLAVLALAAVLAAAIADPRLPVATAVLVAQLSLGNGAAVSGVVTAGLLVLLLASAGLFGSRHLARR